MIFVVRVCQVHIVNASAKHEAEAAVAVLLEQGVEQDDFTIKAERATREEAIRVAVAEARP